MSAVEPAHPVVPVACTLDGREAGARLAAWRTLNAAGLLDSALVAGGLRLRYAREPGVRAKLAELVEAERACCPFLDFDLSDADGAVVLTVSGPPEAASAIEALARFARASATHRPLASP